MGKYLSTEEALKSAEQLFKPTEINTFGNSGFEEAAQRTAASLARFENQWENRSYVPPAQAAQPDIFDRTIGDAKEAQRKANYEYLQRLANRSSQPKITTQALPSGRDFAVMPGVETGGRLGAGINSIIQTGKAAFPMLGSEAAQIARNAAAAADSRDYAAKRAQLFMAQNGLSQTPEYEKRKAEEAQAREALQSVIQNEGLDKPPSPDALGMRMMDKAKDYQRQAVEGLSPAGQFIGNTLISIGQNAALMPTAAAHPALPLVGMGAISAADKSYELSKQGVGAGEALARGLASGGVEALTEKLPLDSLFKAAKSPAGRGAIKSILKQMGLEATEEAVSYTVNYGLDRLAADPNASFSLTELALAGAGGAFSGGIMGAGAIGLGRFAGLGAGDAQYRGQNQRENVQNPANSQTIGDLERTNGKAAQQAPLANAVGSTSDNAPVKAGRATTIYNPFSGDVPVNLQNSTSIVDVPESAYTEAVFNIQSSQTTAAAEGKSARGFLKSVYEKLFDEMGGARGIALKNVQFGNEPYIVTLNKNSISKVISDKNLSAEKLAVFNDIDNIVEQGEFIGSGEYAPLGDKRKKVIRYDYFETPIKIGNNEYVVTFDVEVYPNTNNYRTHKVINNLDLIPTAGAGTGPVPAAAAAKPSPAFILSQRQNEVNNSIPQNEQNNAPQGQETAPERDILAPLREGLERKRAARERLLEPLREGLERRKAAGTLNSPENADGEAGTSESGQAQPIEQSLQDALYRLGERGINITQGGRSVTAGERSGAYEQRKMREYGVDNVDELIARMTTEDFEEYQRRQAQDDEAAWEAFMYNANQEELARRARTAARAPDEKTAELLSNPDNGIIAAEGINESARMLTNVNFAANKHISQVLDAAAKGAKGDLKLLPHQTKQLRQMLYNAIEKPLSQAKAKYVAGIKAKAEGFAAEMERLGIKAGSRESAAAQWIGEGQRQGPDGKITEYTLADLQREFPESWRNIEEASRICRSIYDAYISEINDALKKVYPDVEKRAAELTDSLNARAAYNSGQAQIWLEKAGQLEQRAAAAEGERHNFDSVAQAKAADRANRLNRQAEAARATAERYMRAAGAAEQKLAELQSKIASGEILRNKRLLPRKDYFHHFNEMEQGIGGFLNIITGSHDISAQLAGKSEFTKPKSKWWGALQQRMGGKYTADAVGGMAKYIPAAEYKIAFDPFIAQMRGTVEALVNATAETKNANSLIEYLTDWTNDLAGKTNFLDRGIQKIFDRRSMKALEWLNSRAKANAVAGNIGSAVVQIGNIPNAMMFIKNPAYFARAAADIHAGKGREAQSIFLNERYINNTLDKLQKSGALQNISNWMLEIGDRQAARLIWNAAYLQYEDGKGKGLRQYESAADYADDITRRSIAGRGVGEMALTQKSRVVKLLAPFQVEVNNTFNLLAEKLGEGDAAALANYMVGAWMINSVLYLLTGRRPLFDPIDAIIDAIKGAMDEDENDQRNALERAAGAAQRIGGELVSNMPYASTAATLLTGADNSASIFGEADPTRYGTGNIAVQTIAKPAAQFLSGQNVDLLPVATSFMLPYGGKQAERLIEGAQSLGALPDVSFNIKDGFGIRQNQFGASRTASGKIRFPITKPLDQLITMAFGEWSTSRGREYLEEKRTYLSDKQTDAMERMFAAGISPDDYYDAVIAARKAKSSKDSNGDTIRLSEDRDKVSLIRQQLPYLSERERRLIYEAIGISKNAY